MGSYWKWISVNPREHGGTVEAFFGELVLGGVGGEHRGSAHDHAFHVLARNRIGAGLQVAEEEGDEVLDEVALVVDDRRGERAERENGLDGLKQAATHLVLDVAELGGVADDGRDALRRVRE